MAVFDAFKRHLPIRNNMWQMETGSKQSLGLIVKGGCSAFVTLGHFCPEAAAVMKQRA
jgi:hypothetical protein